MRNTSLEAYKRLHCKGQAQTQAYKLLRAMNKGEDYSLSELEQLTGIRINSVSGRVNELKAQHFLQEAARRKCRITGESITPVYRPGMKETTG